MINLAEGSRTSKTILEILETILEVLEDSQLCPVRTTAIWKSNYIAGWLHSRIPYSSGLASQYNGIIN